MYKRVFRWVFWVLTVILMITIFCFSAQKAEVSQKTSEGFTKKVLSTFQSFNKLPEPKQDQIVYNVQFSVRKAAHFSVFAALGTMMMSAMYLTFDKKRLWLYTYIISTLYAVSDEFHQYFVPGRACRIGDMILDSMGVTAGILVVMIICLLYKIKKRRMQ
jgi:VanZ family protein